MQNRGQGRKSAKKKRGSMRKTWLLFGCAMTVLAAIIVVPSPYMQHGGSVTLCGDESAEKYGPEVPKNIVNGYTAPVVKSVVLPAKDENADDGKIYVYASKKQENYHLGTCKFAQSAGEELTLYEAYYLGFTPGKCCDAPSYTGF